MRRERSGADRRGRPGRRGSPTGYQSAPMAERPPVPDRPCRSSVRDSRQEERRLARQHGRDRGVLGGVVTASKQYSSCLTQTYYRPGDAASRKKPFSSPELAVGSAAGSQYSSASAEASAVTSFIMSAG